MHILLSVTQSLKNVFFLFPHQILSHSDLVKVVIVLAVSYSVDLIHRIISVNLTVFTDSIGEASK